MSATMVCMVFCLAAVSQDPADGDSDSARPTARQKAQSGEINRRDAKPDVKAKTAGARQVEAEVARRRAARRGRAERDRREFERNEKLQAQAREEYRRMLPFLLESQRLQLERMSAYERNVALNRIAAANEVSARAIAQAAAAYANQNSTTAGPNNTPNTPYGPFGFAGIPAVQGTPNFTLNTANVYNSIGAAGVPVP